MDFFIRHTLLFLLSTFCSYSLYSQYNQWTWMHGNNVPNGFGIYGSKGVASTANNPAGVYEAVEWTDLQGNFWFYGGKTSSGIIQELNDLWKYDPNNDTWTWVHGNQSSGVDPFYTSLGVANIANTPGARSWGAISWVDNNGNLWLFGGNSASNIIGIGRKNDLWKFDVAIGMWTYYGGTASNLGGVYGSKGTPSILNWPGCRDETDAAWVDANNNFWIFGGMGFDANGTYGRLGDLWKYDPVAQLWTWMSGDDIVDQSPFYGAKGVASPANKPGGVGYAYTTWKNPITGNFYLLGGESVGAFATGEMNDIWMFDPQTVEWTWLNGQGAALSSGNLGNTCVPSNNNFPNSLGLVEGRIRWVDDCGNAWVYMGYGYNTLMHYSIANDTWTRVYGGNVFSISAYQPFYGAIGVASPANNPGMRQGGNAWRRIGENALWLASGEGRLPNGTNVKYNDLWKYTPDKPTAAFIYGSSGNCTSSVISFTNQSTPGCNEIKEYLWNFDDPSSGGLNTSTVKDPSHTYFSSGNYNVKLLVVNCTGSKDSLIMPVTVVASVLSATISETDVSCNGQMDGAISVSNVNGNFPYNYNWSNGATTTSLSGLSSGIYSITISDASNCTFSKTVTITEPPPIYFNTTITNVSCYNGSNGNLQSAPTGGNGGYQYLWSNNSTNSTISNIPAGLYSLSITDNLGCIKDTSIQVTSPTQTSLLYTSIDETCGSSNGIITTTVSGGILPYSYFWSNASTLANISNLSAGNYSLTISDQNNCITNYTILVIASGAPTIQTLSTSSVTCNGDQNGSIEISAGNSIGPYTYLWSNAETTSLISNLSGGQYSVTVTDANNCIASQLFLINEPNQILANITKIDILCSGNTTAAIQSVANGGSGIYQYFWSTNASTYSITGIGAGIYTVSVLDSKGCLKDTTVQITQPQPLVVVFDSFDEYCGNADGVITTTVSGGVATYNYYWSNGSTLSTISNLVAGTYSVTIVDQNNCVLDFSVSVGGGGAPSLQVISTNSISCFGFQDGAIDVATIGGAPPLLYLWNNGSTTNDISSIDQGVYSLTVTDANACTAVLSNLIIQEPLALQAILSATNVCAGVPGIITTSVVGGVGNYSYLWNTGGSNALLTNISNAGIYSLSVTDENGCMASSSVTINFYPLPQVSFTASDTTLCGATCISLVPNDFNFDTYTWYLGNGGISNAPSPQECYSLGDYTVSLSVTDTNGCSNSSLNKISISVYPLPIAAFTSAPNDLTELDATVYFTDQSVGATNWFWNFGDSLNSSSNIQNPNFTYLKKGIYCVELVVSNAYDCYDTTDLCIEVKPDRSFYIPNSFTPNGDNMNDFFFGKGTGITNYKLDVYDRWGELIFTTNEVSKIEDATMWNGNIKGSQQQAQQDVYIWKVYYRDVLGVRQKLVGHVSLIR